MKTRDYDMPPEQFQHLLDQETKLHNKNLLVNLLGTLLLAVGLGAAVHAVHEAYGAWTSAAFVFAYVVYSEGDRKFGTWAQERVWSEAYLAKMRPKLEVEPTAEVPAGTE